MSRPDPVETARAVVGRRCPDAVQAWLSGSVVRGTATSTSDLDVMVLLPPGRDADAHRESLVVDGWPVELFVNTERVVRWFLAQEIARRSPNTARIVADGVPLLPGTAGEALQRTAAELLSAGPPPVPPAALARMRYGLTDLLDDLAGSSPGPLRSAVVVSVWRETAELLLAAYARWTGGGKWLVREVQALDAERGSAFAGRLDAGLHAALAGDAGPLVAVADEVLAPLGGRLWAGFSEPAPDAAVRP